MGLRRADGHVVEIRHVQDKPSGIYLFPAKALRWVLMQLQSVVLLLRPCKCWKGRERVIDLLKVDILLLAKAPGCQRLHLPALRAVPERPSSSSSSTPPPQRRRSRRSIDSCPRRHLLHIHATINVLQHAQISPRKSNIST